MSDGVVGYEKQPALCFPNVQAAFLCFQTALSAESLSENICRMIRLFPFQPFQQILRGDIFQSVSRFERHQEFIFSQFAQIAAGGI